MRVLFLSTSFPDDPEDPKVFFIRQLAEALARQRCRVTVLTPAGPTPAPAWPGPVTVKRFRYAPQRRQVLAQLPGGIPAALEADPTNRLLVPPFLASFLWGIGRLCRENDVILANWAICGALTAFIRPWRRRHLITVLRGSDVRLGPDGKAQKNLILNMALQKSRAVAVVGRELADLVRPLVDRPEKVRHIPNGVNEHFLNIPPPPTEGPVRAIFVGSLIPRKGVEVLLRAMSRTEDLHLTLAGDGPERPDLEALAQRLGLLTRVEFLGPVAPGADLARQMARAHFLVLPSHHEGRPNAAIEAMAGARPVVGSDIPGLRELVLQSGCGRLTPDGDPTALAEALTDLARSPEKRLRMGAAARGWVLDQGLTWENAAARYIELMMEIAGPGKHLRIGKP